MRDGLGFEPFDLMEDAVQGRGGGSPMIIYRPERRVLVQGITGKQGRFWTEKMMAQRHASRGRRQSETRRREHLGVPVFAISQRGDGETPFDVGGHVHPAVAGREAALDAIEAGVSTVVILTEHIPAPDAMAIHHAADGATRGSSGPNTAGARHTRRRIRRHHARA